MFPLNYNPRQPYYRDLEIVAHLFDGRNSAVMCFIAQVIRRTRACGRKIGICGQARATIRSSLASRFRAASTALPSAKLS